MRRFALIAVWGLTLLAPPGGLWLRADVVYLKDGSKVEGELIRKTREGWAVKGADGKIVEIAGDDVRRFEARRDGPAGDESMRGLASLRRSVDGQSDVGKILERYRTFVEQHIGTPVADAALADVQVWEDRLERNMVKVGDNWLTPAQRDELQEKAGERAAEARGLLLQGRLKDATAVLDSALSENPDNAAAQYLRGVVLFRQDQTINARKAFEAAAKLSPNHGPTLNNLAVIMWAAKQYPGALNLYGEAMNALPGDRHLLDNVAEALNELPERHRDNAATKKVVLMFNAQDMALQGRMKQRGLFRWGSTWVEEKALADLGVEERRIDDKIERLEDEFETVQDRLEQIARDIGDTERSIRRIEASSYGRDATGRPVRLSYPRLYYDLKRDLEQLYGERDSERGKVTRLRAKARQVKQELTVPRYTGIQQIVGVEGTPGLPPLTEDDAEGRPETPASAPATEPATPKQAVEADAD